MNTPNLFRRVCGHFLVAAGLTFTAIAQAQENVTWQAPADISGASDVSTQGTFYGSWAPYDGSANTLPVNGVVFQGYATPPGFNPQFPSNDQSGYNGFANPNTTNANYNALLQYATYAGSGSGTITVTWNDTPGHTYLIQLWANDGRGLFNGRTETVTGGNNTSANLNFGSAPGQYIIGTYVADSSGSETITLSGASSTNGDDPQVNLLQLRDVTETTVTNYQSAVLADNPLAFYALNPATDPSGVSPDLTGNGNDGTANQITPAIGPTPFITNAANFELTNQSYDILSFGNNPGLLNFSGPITLEAWVQPASSTEYGDIVAKGYDASSGDSIGLTAQGPYGADYDADSGSVNVYGGVQSTNWTYLVLSSDGITSSLYVNGQLATQSADVNGAVNFSDEWNIGDGSSAGNARYFSGNISEVAIYNYGLSASQVSTHYFFGEHGISPDNSVPIITSQPVPQVSYVGGSATFNIAFFSSLPATNQWYQGSTPIIGATNTTLVLTNVQPDDAVNYHVTVGNSNGSTNSSAVSLTLSLPTPTIYESTVLSDQPLAYYPLDPAVDSTAIAYDWSGNGNNGVYTNTVAGFNNYPGPTAYITNAANFSGTTYANLSTGPNAGLLNFGGQITLEAWVQPANTSQNLQDILAKGYDGNLNDAEIALREDSATFNALGVSGGVAQQGNWSYVVASYNGSEYTLYVNGALVASNQSGSGVEDFNDPWSIGSGSGSGINRLFSGNLSQVALYNYGLSANQVFAHYYAATYGSGNPSNAIPIISSAPTPQTAYAGGSVQFSVTALSLTATTNQWYQNGAPLAGQTNAILELINVQSGNVGNYSVTVGNINGRTNTPAVSLSLLTPGASLTWSANNNSGTWDTDISTNWINQASDLPSVFNTGDAVLFNDTPGVPTTVTVSNTVSPGSFTVDSINNNFSINGPGTISGVGSLVKEGPSTLSITSGGNFSGSATIAGGVLYAGNNCLQSVSEIVITNNSTMDLGGGTLNNNKPVILSGTGFDGEGAISNSYGDYPVESLNITLAGDTLFSGSARWDLASGSQISGPHSVSVDWSANSQNGYYGQWTSVTIGANVTGIILTNALGGTSTETTLGLLNMDTAFQNPSTFVTVTTNSALDLYSDGFNGSIHVLDGGTANLLNAPGALTGPNVVLEGGAAWQSYGGSGNQSIDSAITLNGVVHFVIGDNNRYYTNVISGAGGFVSDYYNHELVFSASNTYSGPTIIGSSGNTPELALTGNGSISHSSLIFFGGNNATVPHIDVSGLSGETLTLASGQTLEGIGGINGSLVVSAGAILSPGGTNTTIGITTGSNPVGDVAASGNVTLGGTTVIKLGNTTNDVVTAAGSLTYGGTLNLVNISGSPLPAAASFQIFNAASYTGAFTSITPATPGPGQTWNTSNLSSTGYISVVGSPSSGPVIVSPTVSSSNLVFSGSGGTANGTYYVQVSTNLLSPNWISVATNSFDASGNFSVTNAVNANTPQKFYRIEQLP
jgi:autotransporter-associated beta strand protein